MLLATLTVPAVLCGGALVGVLSGDPSPARTVTAAAAATTPAADPAADPTDAARAPASAASASASASASAAAALAAVGAAATAADGTIEVVVLAADGSTLLSGGDADQPIATASLVKLLVVQQLLERDEAGTLTLTAADRALMARAVEASDDEAMDELWVDFGGSALVTAAATEFGLTGTATTEVPGQWGQATTTAADYAAFLAALPDHLSPADAATLTGWTQSTTDEAADGFDQDYGVRSAAVLATGAVAAKQGWMCCVDARRQVHSAGVLADGRVVVLLGDFSSGTSWATARAALDSAAQAVVGGT